LGAAELLELGGAREAEAAAEPDEAGLGLGAAELLELAAEAAAEPEGAGLGLGAELFWGAAEALGLGAEEGFGEEEGAGLAEGEGEF
jgi:hypothetical protein